MHIKREGQSFMSMCSIYTCCVPRCSIAVFLFHCEVSQISLCELKIFLVIWSGKGNKGEVSWE